MSARTIVIALISVVEKLLKCQPTQGESLSNIYQANGEIMQPPKTIKGGLCRGHVNLLMRATPPESDGEA